MIFHQNVAGDDHVHFIWFKKQYCFLFDQSELHFLNDFNYSSQRESLKKWEYSESLDDLRHFFIEPFFVLVVAKIHISFIHEIDIRIS